MSSLRRKDADPVRAEITEHPTQRDRWHGQCSRIVSRHPQEKIRVIGVPLDLGQQRRGVDMGPSAVRVAGLEANSSRWVTQVEDAGNIAHAPRAEGLWRRALRATSAKSPRPAPNWPTKSCTPWKRRKLRCPSAGITPLRPARSAAWPNIYRREGQHIGLIWIDAHSDINTPETSLSGNVHGMPLAASWD